MEKCEKWSVCEQDRLLMARCSMVDDECKSCFLLFSLYFCGVPGMVTQKQWETEADWGFEAAGEQMLKNQGRRESREKYASSSKKEPNG